MPSDPRPFSFYQWSIVTMVLSRTDTVIFSRWPWSEPLETFKNFKNFENFCSFWNFWNHWNFWICQKNFHHSKAHIWYFWYLWNFWFWGDPRSKICSPFQSPYMPFYLTKFLGFDLDLWPLGVYLSYFHWHFLSISYPRSNIFPPFESPYMPFYLTSIGTFSLSRTVFEIFDFKVFRVWLWPLTFRGHLRSKIFPPFESPYMISHSTPIDTFSLSRTVFEIFDFKVFRVWPWPLTFRGHLRSNICSPFESPYMTSYLTSIDTFSLSRTVFKIFDFKVFRIWLWPLSFRGHPRSNKCSPFESTYMTSYLTSIDTFSLYRTVFEIFDFKVFRVWPWPLTFRGDPKSKIFLSFERPYMLSYLTPIGTFFLSRTVYEIFDFKVFRVWPWPLTFRGDPKSKICSSFESPYMTFYLTSIDTFYLVPFLRYSAIAVWKI